MCRHLLRLLRKYPYLYSSTLQWWHGALWNCEDTAIYPAFPLVKNVPLNRPCNTGHFSDLPSGKIPAASTLSIHLPGFHHKATSSGLGLKASTNPLVTCLLPILDTQIPRCIASQCGNTAWPSVDLLHRRYRDSVKEDASVQSKSATLVYSSSHPMHSEWILSNLSANISILGCQLTTNVPYYLHLCCTTRWNVYNSESRRLIERWKTFKVSPSHFLILDILPYLLGVAVSQTDFYGKALSDFWIYCSSSMGQVGAAAPSFPDRSKSQLIPLSINPFCVVSDIDTIRFPATLPQQSVSQEKPLKIVFSIFMPSFLDRTCYSSC